MSPVATAVFIGICIAALVAFDVYLWLDSRDGNTYSEVTTKFGKVWPPFRIILSVTFGVLLGHFFWPPS